MTFELWILLAAIVLGFLHILLQAHSASLVRGLHWNAGPRDEAMPPLPGQAGRLERALRNYLESFPFFAATVLVAAAAGTHNMFTELGAGLYLAGRVAYLPLYAFGVRYIRSLAWNVATLGIILIMTGIVVAAT
jgi:uncharacterized MAPEG superfamily protein